MRTIERSGTFPRRIATMPWSGTGWALARAISGRACCPSPASPTTTPCAWPGWAPTAGCSAERGPRPGMEGLPTAPLPPAHPSCFVGRECGPEPMFAGCWQRMWASWQLIWARDPGYCQRIWAENGDVCGHGRGYLPAATATDPPGVPFFLLPALRTPRPPRLAL